MINHQSVTKRGIHMYIKKISEHWEKTPPAFVSDYEFYYNVEPSFQG